MQGGGGQQAWLILREHRARALRPRSLGGAPKWEKRVKDGREIERERERERETERERERGEKNKEIVTRMAWGPKKIFWAPLL